MTQNATTPVPATQTKHPWRAVIRTAVAAAVAGVTLVPEIVTAAHIGTVPTVAQIVAVSMAVTRVLAVPGVNAWLGTYLPWLAASPTRP